jgi:hypothetical protein
MKAAGAQQVALRVTQHRVSVNGRTIPLLILKKKTSFVELS